MPRTKPKAALILGAGWSFAAGLPLTKDLFKVNLSAASKTSEDRLRRVAEAYDTWATATKPANGELFLEVVHREETLPWAWAVEYVSTVLANPVRGDTSANQNLRYSQRLTNPTYCSTHRAFLKEVLTKYELSGVITTNYDILAERALRHRTMSRPSTPGFHYGGLPRPQFAHGLAQPFSVSRPDRAVELTGTVPLYKLHGSLNWQRQDSEIELYQDLRLAFKSGGVAEIVPPVTEKSAPSWLLGVWKSAETCLSGTDAWIVGGFSLPPYDLAIRSLFSRAAELGNVKTISIFDPYAQGLSERWRSMAPTAELDLHQEGIPRCALAASLDRRPADASDPSGLGAPRLPGI